MNDKQKSELAGQLKGALSVIEGARRLAVEIGRETTADELTKLGIMLVATIARIG